MHLEEMMRMFLILAVIAMSPAVAFPEETKLGQPVDVAAATSISDILAQPESYLGRTVRIEGEVTNVCPEMGCWMEVRDPQTRKSLRVKVDDGQIVFPKTAKGRMVTAQGKIEKMALTREQYIAYLEHEAQELGTKADTSGVKSGATIYRLRGAGAVIR
jgi:starvation-inducible outer membrane lipoprotein